MPEKNKKELTKAFLTGGGVSFGRGGGGFQQMW